MTAKEAKEKTFELWEYLVEHPEVIHNKDIPKKLKKYYVGFLNWCPLCTYNNEQKMACKECILVNCRGDSLFRRWRKAQTNEERQQAAQAIVDKVMSWEVEDD
jgi:hypothetical protein